MYKWTLPVTGEETPGNFQFAYLALPTRLITREEYQHILKMIELFEPALVLGCCKKQQRDILPAFWNFVRGK